MTCHGLLRSHRRHLPYEHRRDGRKCLRCDVLLDADGSPVKAREGKRKTMKRRKRV